MDATYRRPSVRTFGAGLILFLVGGGLFTLNIWPRTAGKIYLSALIAGPALAIAGLWTAASSLRARFCSRCRHELASASGTYAAESESAIRALLESGRRPAPEEIRFSGKAAPYTRVDLEYCPACVAIGEARLRTTDGVPKTYGLSGTAVRVARESLFL